MKKQYKVQTSYAAAIPRGSRNGASEGLRRTVVTSSGGGNVDLSSKLDASAFYDLFEKVNIGTASEPQYAIRAKYGLYSDPFLSAKGSNPDAGAGGGGGATALSQLTDVLLSSLTSGDILSYNGSKWVNISQSSIVPALSEYATRTWVQQQGYATSAALTAHAGDATIHISSAERTLWNKTANDLSSILGTDSDQIINKWEEVVAFLDTYTEADTLANLLSNKADKTTKVIAGTGLTGGGALTGNVTLSLASRTLWGQTFDGSGNVSGNMTGVGSISSSGEIITTSQNAFRMAYGNYGSFFRQDGTYLWLMLTNKDDAYGTFNSLRPFYVELANGNVHVDTELVVKKRVYFGDSTHYIELDSDGHFHFSHGVYSDEYLSVKGSNPDAGAGGTGGATTLSQLTDVSLSGLASGQLLMYNGSKWTNVAQSTIVPTLKNLTFGSKTYNGTTAQTITAADLGALTSHQTLYSLAFQAGAFEAKKYTPNTGAQTVNIPTSMSHIYDDIGYMYHYRQVGVNANDLLRISIAEINGGSNMPTPATWHQVMAWGTSDNGYVVQLATPYVEEGSLYLRHKTINAWRSWREILDSVNYKSYTVSKTGEGASGTWSIGISGTAATATSAEAANTTRKLEAFADDTFTNGQHYIKAIRDASGWTTRLWMCYSDGAAQANAVWVYGADVAVKLQSAHTMWGQAFDGTASVSGDMTGVGNLSASGRIQLANKVASTDTILLSQHPNFAVTYGNKWGVYMWATGNGRGHIQVGNQDDNATMYSLVLQELGGNVGIGTAAPAYKLDVNGATRINDNLYLASYGTTYLGKGTGDGATWATYNVRLHLHYGMAIADNADNINFLIDARLGNFSAKGTIYATKGIYSDGYMSAKGINTASDVRLKRRREDVALTVRDVAEAPVYRFEWINGGGIDVGSTAQYWAARVPELTHLLADGIHLGLDYGKAALLSVVAVARSTADHERRIASLERQLQNRTI